MNTMECWTSPSVILTAIYAILTLIIAGANWKAVATMKMQVLASTRPFVHFDVRLEGVAVIATIINSGVSTAHEVTIKCDPVVISFADPSGQKPAILPSGRISLLVPKHEIKEYLGTWEQVKEGGQACPFKVIVSYCDSSGTKFEEKGEISVDRLEGLLFLKQPDIAKELEKIAKACEKVAFR